MFPKKQKLLKNFFIIFTLLVLITPFSFAQAKLTANCDGINCNLCSFFDMVNNIVNWAIGMAFWVALVLVVVGGIWMIVAGYAEGVTRGRQIITSAIIGLLIVLGAWLAINTIIAVLAPGSGEWNVNGVNLTQWYEINCEAEPFDIIQEIEDGGFGPTGAIINLPNGGPQIDLSKATSSSQDGNEIIYFFPDGSTYVMHENGSGDYTSGDDTYHYEPPSTGEKTSTKQELQNSLNSTIQLANKPDENFDNVQKSAVKNLNSIDSSYQTWCLVNKNGDCSDLVITDATGTGHASGDYSHENGYKFDIAANTNFIEMLQKNDQFVIIGTRNDTANGGKYGGPVYMDSETKSLIIIEEKNNNLIDVVAVDCLTSDQCEFDFDTHKWTYISG